MPPRPDRAEAAHVLAALDPEQQAAARALTGPVCVLAGAGTGKTRAITHRIAYGVLTGAFDPRQVLAVTFTTRAAGEMRGRLRQLGVDGVQARTFHSAALRQARFFWPKLVGGELPPIMDRKLPLVREALNRCRVGADSALLRDVAGEIEWAKVSNVGPEDYPRRADAGGRAVAGLTAEVVGRLYAAYEQARTDRGVIDLEDVLLCAVSLLDGHPGVAEQVRSQYAHFVVDEYQDVSPLQQSLLELWLGGRRDVCVVGDANQTIYSFAGARADYLVGFPDRYPDATVVRLVRDYRSTPQVVEVANRVLARATGAAARHRLVLAAQRPDGPRATLTEHPDEVAEAAAVARTIRRALDSGTPAREVALLYRVNAQSEAYEQALAEAGVPYVLRGAERFFDRPEVRQARMLLRGAARATAAGASPAGASPAGASPAGSSEPGADLVADTGADLVSDTSAVLAGMGWTPDPPAATGAARERWESLAALIGLAAEVATASPGAGMAELCAELEARASAQHAPTADGVTLASLHATKGLEWDAVFIVGCQDGTLPIGYAESDEEIEEERRLLYVGVTRARRQLHVSWAAARAPGGRPVRRPSRFLDGVFAPASAGAARGAGHRGTRGSGKVARCRICKQPLHDAAERKLGRCAGCPSTIDEGLYDRLRTWRLEVAREASVPAYVVFTDATLQAIAEMRPTDHRALAGIPGVGTTKLARYGPAVLALCAAPDLADTGSPDEIEGVAVASYDRIGPRRERSQK